MPINHFKRYPNERKISFPKIIKKNGNKVLYFIFFCALEHSRIGRAIGGDQFFSSVNTHTGYA